MTKAYARIPWDILDSDMSPYAKVLFAAIYNRFAVSQKNGWKDENGRTYVIFTLAEAMRILRCSKSKASKVLSELDGLIERKRVGLCKPDMIYINTQYLTESAEKSSAEFFEPVIQEETPEELSKEPRSPFLQTSGGILNTPQEYFETDSNKNNINNNNLNNNNSKKSSYHIISTNWIEDRNEYIKKIKINIEYDYLISNNRKEIIDEIISVMVNAICSKKDLVCIGGEQIPHEAVKEKLLSLDSGHVEYVCECKIDGLSISLVYENGTLVKPEKPNNF